MKKNLPDDEPDFESVIEGLETSVDALGGMISLLMPRGSLASCSEDEIISLLSLIKEDVSQWSRQAARIFLKSVA